MNAKLGVLFLVIALKVEDYIGFFVRIWIPQLVIKDTHYGAKATKNQTPLVRFAWFFYNQTIFQKSVWGFFDQVARDAKNV